MNRPALHPALIHLAALALASVALLSGAAKAQTPPSMLDAPAYPSGGAGQTVTVDLSGAAGRSTRTLALPLGKSAVIELPVDARDVMVTNPKIADVVLSTPRRIYVLGQTAGETDATFVDGMGRQILRLNVRVDQDTSAVSQTLEHILPGSSIRADAVNQTVILSGEVQSAADADKAIKIASSFVGPDRVINMMSVAQPEQVMLKVRIVEVNRQVVKQLGVNLNALISKVGDSNFSFAQAATYGVNGALEGGATVGDQYANKAGTKTADAVIGAFERVGLIRTLAEPNLTTVSGEAAKFLAGGEFPVPSGTALTASVEYKQFGVGLGFTPMVLSKGRISLKLSTEYSVLSSVGALTVAGGATTNLADGASSSSSGSGSTTTPTTTSSTTTGSTTYPALSVRRAETVVELPSGGSMMIAGLLQSSTQQDIGSLPGLMQLPVLGALFRSRDFQQNDTELVVIVTPYLVTSTSADKIQTPADGLQIADDVSAILLGRMNKSFSKPAPPPAGRTYEGPFGYVVE